MLKTVCLWAHCYSVSLLYPIAYGLSEEKGMFKLKVSDAKLLRDMVTAISILVDEATFKIDPDGLKLRAMDPSRVAMIDFEWPKTVFKNRDSGAHIPQQF